MVAKVSLQGLEIPATEPALADSDNRDRDCGPEQPSLALPRQRTSSSLRQAVLQFTPYSVLVYYLWLESRAEIINVSYRMDSTIAPDRHSAAVERVDSSSVLAAFKFPECSDHFICFQAI